ncbi:MAG: HD domain-containing protein [Oligoflexia bacterium]|nr:HD domain-containing protein [Oligoflexia bacterium]
MAIEVFLRLQGALPFDVFIKISEDKYTKIFNLGDVLDAQRLQNYMHKGAQKLYIQTKDRRQYINSTDKLIRKMIQQEKLSLSEAAFAVEELSEQILFEIYEDGIFDQESLFKAQALAKSYIQLLKKDVNVLTQFLKMSKNETYMVRHSISTAIIGLLIARADNNNNDKILEIICLGGLLHDIGMSFLPSDIGETDRKLTDSEWLEIRKHPHLGLQMIEGIEYFPSEIKEVITQHHEYYNGTGYPKGLRGEEIYYPARVIALADAFSALTTRRGGRSLLTPAQAMNVLNSERGKYDPKLIKAFSSLLSSGTAKAKKAA